MPAFLLACIPYPLCLLLPLSGLLFILRACLPNCISLIFIFAHTHTPSHTHTRTHTHSDTTITNTSQSQIVSTVASFARPLRAATWHATQSENKPAKLPHHHLPPSAHVPLLRSSSARLLLSFAIKLKFALWNYPPRSLSLHTALSNQAMQILFKCQKATPALSPLPPSPPAPLQFARAATIAITGSPRTKPKRC